MKNMKNIKNILKYKNKENNKNNENNKINISFLFKGLILKLRSIFPLIFSIIFPIIFPIISLMMPQFATAQQNQPQNSQDLNQIKKLVSENDAKNPKVLTIAFASIEDNALYDELFSKFIYHLRQCTAMPVLVYPIYQEAQVLNALKEGKLHLASLGTGATMFAANDKIAMPFVSRGSIVTKKNEQYELLLISKAGGNFKKPLDLKGKKIAHTTLTSNSGNLAPRALFPSLGLTPDVNYNVEFSGRHDKSILGVKNGFYDGAAVASDVFNRMIANHQIKENEFNVLWKSQPFPTNSFAYNINLSPQILKKLKTCFLKYEFPKEKAGLLNNNTIFVEVNYDKDWQVVRQVYEKSKQK